MARLTRRTFLRTTGIIGGSVALTGFPYVNRSASGEQPYASTTHSRPSVSIARASQAAVIGNS